MSAQKKVISIPELAPLVAKLRKEGKRIVTTCGTFDLLHVGHVRALKESKAQGDVLIVGINSDASVKQYKSPLRPIIGETDRAEMLAALSSVDYVVIFNEPDPLSFLRTVKPDVHTKGEEYDPKDLKEYGLITEYGGVIVSTGRYTSTTDIIEKIRKTYE